MERKCFNCAHRNDNAWHFRCAECAADDYFLWIGKKQTNADKYFRNATDEEIAEIIVEDWCELLNCNCQIEKSLYRTCDGMCKERVLNWLKKEVESNVCT